MPSAETIEDAINEIVETSSESTPPSTDEQREQREQWAKEAEMMERAAESAALKARADKDWKLQQFHSPYTIDERRERERSP